jgi:SAM-dependent methyltransferase
VLPVAERAGQAASIAPLPFRSTPTESLQRRHARDADARIDFMSAGWHLIGEPLNLHEAGQRWFADVCGATQPDRDSLGIVLGATAWMGSLLRGMHREVALVDMSQAMLAMARAELGAEAAPTGVEFVQGHWQHLPAWRAVAGTVLGDNSFSFLEFPDGWTRLADQLADRMHPGARLFIRVLSMPVQHRAATVGEIVEQFVARESINFTEVRAALLFAHWRQSGYRIDTEEVLRTFESHAAAFAPLLDRCPPGQANDLVTVTKYRGSGAVYYAPPLDEILHALRLRFRIKGVHFGPYAMAEYFPLVVAERI